MTFTSTPVPAAGCLTEADVRYILDTTATLDTALSQAILLRYPGDGPNSHLTPEVLAATKEAYEAIQSARNALRALVYAAPWDDPGSPLSATPERCAERLTAAGFRWTADGTWKDQRGRRVRIHQGQRWAVIWTPGPSWANQAESDHPLGGRELFSEDPDAMLIEVAQSEWEGR